MDLIATYGNDIKANYDIKYKNEKACVLGIVEIAQWETYALAVKRQAGVDIGEVIAKSKWTSTIATPMLYRSLRDTDRIPSLAALKDQTGFNDGRTHIRIDQKLVAFKGEGSFSMKEILIALSNYPGFKLK